MLSPAKRIATRTKVMAGLIGVLVIILLCGAAIQLSRTTISVGQTWSESERVACGDVSHQQWDELLHRFVDSQGNVDYQAWKQSAGSQQQLNEYFRSLSRMDEGRPANKSQRFAFWINAYNALTVYGILREYPTSGIQNHVSQIGGYNIWRDLRLIVGARQYSLGEIEHTVLRPMGEPRIHFSIVCASRGCPRLRNEAYSAARLEEQLQEDAFAFFAEPSKCTLDSAKNELRLSPILKWYAADFGSSTRERLHRIITWMPADVSHVVKDNDVEVVYVDYDWSLNDASNAAAPLPPVE